MPASGAAAGQLTILVVPVLLVPVLVVLAGTVGAVALVRALAGLVLPPAHGLVALGQQLQAGVGKQHTGWRQLQLIAEKLLQRLG